MAGTITGNIISQAGLGVYRGIRFLFWNIALSVLQIVDSSNTLARLQVADPDPTAAGDNDALNRKVGDLRYEPAGSVKSGTIGFPLGGLLGINAGTVSSTAKIPVGAVINDVQIVTGATACAGGSTATVGYVGQPTAYGIAADFNLTVPGFEGQQQAVRFQLDAVAREVLVTIVLGGAVVPLSSAYVFVSWSIPKP